MGPTYNKKIYPPHLLSPSPSPSLRPHSPSLQPPPPPPSSLTSKACLSHHRRHQLHLQIWPFSEEENLESGGCTDVESDMGEACGEEVEVMRVASDSRRHPILIPPSRPRPLFHSPLPTLHQLPQPRHHILPQNFYLRRRRNRRRQTQCSSDLLVHVLLLRKNLHQRC